MNGYLAKTWMTDSHLSSDHLITSEMGYAHMICFVNPQIFCVNVLVRTGTRVKASQKTCQRL